ELEARDERGGERSELERGLLPRDERDDERAGHEQRLEDGLHEVQVRNPARVVLPPVPERPRRLAADLPADRAIPGEPQLVERPRLEQDDREGGERRDRKPGEEPA